MNIKEQMDSVYQRLALDKIPWNLEKPPRLLVELVESGWITPCKAADLGCGAGNYSVWLASKGFEVTGIDISPKAAELAGNLASRMGVECRFAAANLLGDLTAFGNSFDFVFDWELLHHIFPQDREKYAGNVHRILRSGGKYFSVCFSEEDPDFGGTGKYRKTPLGTTLYFSSEQELRDLFEPGFRIIELYTTEIAGKYGPHKAVAAKMAKKDTLEAAPCG